MTFHLIVFNVGLRCSNCTNSTTLSSSEKQIVDGLDDFPFCKDCGGHIKNTLCTCMEKNNFETSREKLRSRLPPMRCPWCPNKACTAENLCMYCVKTQTEMKKRKREEESDEEEKAASC